MMTRTQYLDIAYVVVVGLLLAAFTSPDAQSATQAPTTAAAATASSGSVVIAQAGSISLDANAVRNLVAALPEAERKAATADAATLGKLVRNELASRALLAEARQAGFEQQPDVKAQLARLQDEAIARLWLARAATVPADYPADADIKAAYDANQKLLVGPTQYRLAQVYIALPEEPAQLSAALKKAAEVGARLGGDFGKLAHDYSAHAESAGKGGDMGYLPDNQLAPEVLAAVRNLKAGETAGPVRTAQGLHFIKLLDRKAGAPLSLAEAHDTLAAALRQRRAGELSQAWANSFGQRLGVRVNEIELGQLRQSLN